LRAFAFAGAAVIGVGLSGMRVVFGRHFLTDVVFGGIVTILVLVLCRSLIFRLDDARLEAGLERAALRLRSLVRRGDGTEPPDDEIAVY
jgi:membrane-associated phospholipid phosphatase